MALGRHRHHGGLPMKPELAPPLWKEQTCESCLYQVKGECRRQPPFLSRSAGVSYPVDYPIVKYAGLAWQYACAEWKRDPTEDMQ